MEKVGDILIMPRQGRKPTACNYRLLVVPDTSRDTFRVPRYQVVDTGIDTITKRHWFPTCVKRAPGIVIQGLRTIHLENSRYFYVNLEEGYYNGRYSEYRRSLLHITGRLVYVLFNGFGPYSVYLGRQNLVVGTDLNPACAYYCRINLALNKVTALTFTQSASATLGRHQLDVVVTVLPCGIYEYIIPLMKKAHTHYGLVTSSKRTVKLLMRLLDGGWGTLVRWAPLKEYGPGTVIYTVVITRFYGSLPNRFNKKPL